MGVAIQVPRSIRWTRRRHLRRRIELEKHRFQRRDQWNVQPVHPNDAIVRFVAVIVPSPTRRQDQITRRHVDTLTVDGRVGAGAFNDEANRRRRVAVRPRDFTGQENLHGGDQIIRRRPTATETGIE